MDIIGDGRRIKEREVIEWKGLTVKALRATGSEKASSVKTVSIVEKRRYSEREILSSSPKWMKEQIISVVGAEEEYKNRKGKILKKRLDK